MTKTIRPGAGHVSTDRQPYGVGDFDQELVSDHGPPRRIRCFVRGCKRMLRPPTGFGGKGDVCPEHGIRCHSSGTYSFANMRDNFIIDGDVLATRVVGHPFKYESDRLNYENSEDALTWNVFRTLQNAGNLRRVATLVTGLIFDEEPKLYLWGLCLTGDSFEPWKSLIDARKKFEGKLPVNRPLTEPDIALHLPGKYLILIEAKFTSSNPFYENGHRKNPTSLTKDELLSIYHDPSLTILNAAQARASKRVFYQLWRNMVFAEWMARSQSDGTQAFLGSLTRRNHEQQSCQEFGSMLNDDSKNRFCHLSWEGLLEACLDDSPRIKRLAKYLRSKTASRQRAFDLQNF